MVWWLLAAGCLVADGESWSRSEPGWDLGAWDCWEPQEPKEAPVEHCQRVLVFELTDWEGDGGTLAGSWDTGVWGEGTVTGEWVWLDDTTREVTGTWVDTKDPERRGEFSAMAWNDQDDRPQIFGWATSAEERAWVGGPGAVSQDGVMRGEVTWSFAEASLEGWLLPRGTWYGHGQWQGAILYGEGEWWRLDEVQGELAGSLFHGQWSGFALGSFAHEADGTGTAGLWVDHWGYFDGTLAFEGAEAAAFTLHGYPEGC